MTALLAVLCATFATSCGGGRPGAGGGGEPGGSATPTPPDTPEASATTTPPRVATRPFEAKVERITSRADVPHSWRPGCPVPLSGLRRLRMTHWGFDGKPHTGVLVVNKGAAEDLAKVFRKLYDKRFPIRRMEPVDKYKGSDFASIEADNTSAFNCRRATGSSAWSEHAYGYAIDLNPCENPYVSASGRVAHKDCVKFRNRRLRAPGMVHKGDAVVRAFADIGWGWGGTWGGPWDYQHFSRSGR